MPVATGPAGLIAVTLPPGSRGGRLTLTWTPPGFRLGIASFFAGLLGALLLAGWEIRRRRLRSRGDELPAPTPPGAPGAATIR